MERLEVKSPSRTVSASGWIVLKSLPSLNQEIRIGSSPERMEQTTVALIPSLRSAPNRKGLITGFSALSIPHFSDGRQTLGQHERVPGTQKKRERKRGKVGESFAVLRFAVLVCKQSVTRRDAERRDLGHGCRDIDRDGNRIHRCVSGRGKKVSRVNDANGRIASTSKHEAGKRRERGARKKGG